MSHIIMVLKTNGKNPKSKFETIFDLFRCEILNYVCRLFPTRCHYCANLFFLKDDAN